MESRWTSSQGDPGRDHWKLNALWVKSEKEIHARMLRFTSIEKQVFHSDKWGPDQCEWSKMNIKMVLWTNIWEEMGETSEEGPVHHRKEYLVKLKCEYMLCKI